MLKKVVFSERALIALLSETQEHIKTETGGVFLGHRTDNVWYVVEMIDPGLNCVFQPAFFEYDDVYLNHLMNKIDRLYKKPLEIIGLWHRHPGSFDQFSGTDDGTNIKYARRHTDGAISSLVNIDPEFRLTVYHVTEPLSYRKVEYVVGDRFFPPDFLAYAPRKRYLDQINMHESSLGTTLLSKIRKASKLVSGKSPIELFGDEYVARKFSFSNIVHEYLHEDSIRRKYEHEYIEPAKLTDDELDGVIESIHDDLEYFEETGIKVVLSLSELGGLEIKDASDSSGLAPISLVVYIRDGQTYLNYNKRTYSYINGMLKEACEFYTLIGGTDL